MEFTEPKGKALKVVGGAVDEQCIMDRKNCAQLTLNFQRFANGVEKYLHPGMLAQWKLGMKNRKTPEYGAPVVVVEVLANPTVDTTFDSGSIYFREKLDIILGFIDDEGEFSTLHYDSRRFEPYTRVGLEFLAHTGFDQTFEN